MDEALPILDGEVLSDEALDVLTLFDLPAPEPTPVPDPEDTPTKLVLRRHPSWVSKATTNRRADLVYDAYNDGQNIREIAEASGTLLGVQLGKSRISQLLAIGTERYDAQTMERRVRGINSSEASLDWAQRKQRKLITTLEGLFYDRASIEQMTDAMAAAPEKAPEVIDKVVEAGKAVGAELARFVTSEGKRVDWLGTGAAKRTQNENKNVNLNVDLVGAARETQAANPVLEGLRQRALAATRQEDQLPDLTGALREGLASGSR